MQFNKERQAYVRKSGACPIAMARFDQALKGRV
jgi:hypothetical protein